tara:strand:- start:1 stop:1545 length:1545 start_codon:yes stop_codon:yes gene_type:complete
MNSYSIDELLTLLNFNCNPRPGEIVNRISEFITMFSDISDNQEISSTNQEIIDFFYNVQDKLLDYYNNYYSVDSDNPYGGITPQNIFDYNIENPNTTLLPYAGPNMDPNIDDNITPQFIVQCHDVSQGIIDDVSKQNQEFLDNYTGQLDSYYVEKACDENIKEKTMLLFLNSEFRTIYTDIDEYTSTNFITTLPNSINNVIKMKIVSSEIPSVNFTFSSDDDNDTIIINISGETISGESIDINYTINIPEGIGLSDSVVEIINEIIDEYNTDLTSSPINYLRYLKFGVSEFSGKSFFRFKTSDEIKDLVVIYNIIDNIDITDISNLYLKYSIYNKFNKPYICSINSRSRQHNQDNFSQSALGILGFDYNDIYDSTGNNIFITNSSNRNRIIGSKIYSGFLESSHLYGQFINNSFYVSIDEFVNNRDNNMLIIGSDNTYLPEDIISYITISRGAFQSSVSTSSSDYNYTRTYSGCANISKLHLKIIDKFGRIVNLHDYPTKFVVELTYLDYCCEI